MKVTTTSKKKSSRYAPVIGLHRLARQSEDKSASTKYKCYKDPSNTKSAQYAVVIYHFDNKGPETTRFLLKKLKSIERGQRVTNGPDKYSLVRQVLKGVALTAFENAATEHGNETVKNYKKCIQAVKVAIFPPKAATRQCRAIAKMRKPIEWSMRQFVARIQEFNNQIPEYPRTDDGSAYSKHPEDELVSFLEDGLPNKYCNFLREHRFNVFDHTMKEFVEFVESRMEPTDAKEEVKKEESNKKAT